MSDKYDDIEILAAEFVLGTLSAEDRRRAEQLVAGDPAFASRVRDWILRLTPMTEAVPPEAPPPEVWARIQAAIGESRQSNVVAPPQLRHAAPSREPAERRPALLERLSFWRWSTLGASAMAATLAALIVFRPDAPPIEPQGRYVAVLNQGAADPAWLVTVDLDRQAVTIRPVAEVGVADRALELWLIDGDEPAPRSLGLLSPEQEISLSLPVALRRDAAQPAVLAVSLEPPGGSPTGLPTGPVVYQGQLLPISD